MSVGRSRGRATHPRRARRGASRGDAMLGRGSGRHGRRSALGRSTRSTARSTSSMACATGACRSRTSRTACAARPRSTIRRSTSCSPPPPAPARAATACRSACPHATSLDRALHLAGLRPSPRPRYASSHCARALLSAGAAVKDPGAGALMLAHVAAGRFDAFYEPHMHPWDALAGLLADRGSRRPRRRLPRASPDWWQVAPSSARRRGSTTR